MKTIIFFLSILLMILSAIAFIIFIIDSSAYANYFSATFFNVLRIDNGDKYAIMFPVVAFPIGFGLFFYSLGILGNGHSMPIHLKNKVPYEIDYIEENRSVDQ